MLDTNEIQLEGLSPEEQEDLQEAILLTGADEDGIASGNAIAAEDLAAVTTPDNVFVIDGMETLQ